MSGRHIEKTHGSRIRLPHGSPIGFEKGCRSAAMCPHHRSAEMLTCVEAAVRRRSDYSLRNLPADQPIPRETPAVSTALLPENQGGAERGPVHGTVYGYRRGCHERNTCPNWHQSKVTCADARRIYFAAYHRRRLTGGGAPLAHGTSNGYLMGCRTESDCPGNDQGTSCSEARADYRRKTARRAGIGPRPTPVASIAAAEAIAALVAGGKSLREIARAAGVGRATVNRIASAPGAVPVLEQTSARLLALARSTSSDADRPQDALVSSTHGISHRRPHLRRSEGMNFRDLTPVPAARA